MRRGKTNFSAHLGFCPWVLALIFVSLAARADLGAKPGTFTLPDPLVMKSGDPVVATNDWMDLRRPEILQQFSGYVFGSGPDWRNMLDHKREMDPQALGGIAVRKQVDLEFYNYGPRTNDETVTNLVFHFLLYTPAATRNPAPIFFCLSSLPYYRDVADPNAMVFPVWDKKTDLAALPSTIVRGDAMQSWPISKILAHGYGIAFMDVNDAEPDLPDGSGWKYGVRSLYLQPGVTNFDENAWGATSVWAWGASRVMDYLQTDKEADATRVILVGEGSMGRTALWAAAEDPRFAGVIACSSGEAGASLARFDQGAGVNALCKTIPYQFCGNFLDYSNDISDLPVDGHMLISLIAPRPVFLDTGSATLGDSPRGEFEAAVAASPAYRLFGEQGVTTNYPPDVMTNLNSSGSLLDSGTLATYTPPPVDKPIMKNLGFLVHAGGSDILSSDWDVFLKFEDMYLVPVPAQ
jgi:hypothetical protein